MEPSIDIGSNVVSSGHTPYVVAEIGANHCGSMQLMIDTVKAAKDCGADAVKLQTWTLGSLFNTTMVKTEVADTIRRLQLDWDQIAETKAFCDRVGIDLILSVFSPNEAKHADGLEVAAIKIASMDVVYLPLLEVVARLRPPVIMSTGMASTGEVLTASRVFIRQSKPYALMHCDSLYPTPEDQAALMNVRMLSKLFKVPVGFSDHTITINAPIAAVALGACIIEKHFTLRMDIDSFDIPVSIIPSEFKKMTKAIRNCFKSTRLSSMSLSELAMRYEMRRSIVATRALSVGHKIRWSDMDYKRPGTGLWPDKAEDLIGLQLMKPVTYGEQILQVHIGGE